MYAGGPQLGCDKNPSWTSTCPNTTLFGCLLIFFFFFDEWLSSYQTYHFHFPNNSTLVPK